MEHLILMAEDGIGICGQINCEMRDKLEIMVVEEGICLELSDSLRIMLTEEVVDHLVAKGINVRIYSMVNSCGSQILTTTLDRDELLRKQGAWRLLKELSLIQQEAA